MKLSVGYHVVTLYHYMKGSEMNFSALSRSKQRVKQQYCRIDE